MANLNWKAEKEYEEITFKSLNGVARIAIIRPETHNAFRPKPVDKMWEALIVCHEIQETMISNI
jgi:naphthoate synthase